MQITPLFTSHYSLGKSILNLDEPAKPKDYSPLYPESIFKICLDNNIKDLLLVDNNMSSVAKGRKYSKKLDLNFYFGLKLILCESMKVKDAESLFTEHKVIILAKRDEGYHKLVRIYSEAATNGFYYAPRGDYSLLEQYWHEDDLLLAHPFYDSFLHRNYLYAGNCSTECNFTKPIFLTEQNDLPFNYLINDALDRYSKDHQIEKMPVKSIYYHLRNSFKSYLANRAIHGRKTLNCPNLDHCSSDQFSFQSWKEENN